MITNAITSAFRIHIKGNLHPLEGTPVLQRGEITDESYKGRYMSVNNKEYSQYFYHLKQKCTFGSAFLLIFKVVICTMQDIYLFILSP